MRATKHLHKEYFFRGCYRIWRNLIPPLKRDRRNREKIIYTINP